ncbi:MAG: lipid-A-disaccharide synthase [Desulfobacteraceae bacterium]|nr:lipid-A-disaccharide synthase [Desulfobacteraceae bacterium]MCF8095068.1 lipid-A-disaccharide synthase [Desulfobacteraceae bacterium]
MNMAAKTGRVMIIAGETSGDNHGSRLVREMAAKAPELEFFGIGGTRMRQAGVEILTDAATLSVVGITEVFSRLPAVIREASRVKKELVRRRPDLLILIDFPDFNLHMAKFAKKRDVSVLYYISPQVWAWRRGRVRRIKKYVDRMAVILPFEAGFYHEQGVFATFVGHPLLDHYAYEGGDNASDFEKPDKTVVGLLPGSRKSEISRNLPVMLAAASRLTRSITGVRFSVSMAPGIDRQILEDFVRPYREVIDIEIRAGGIEDVLKGCTLVVAASGTVTLEAAIFGVPMVIIYRVSQLSYLLGRMLISVDHIGMANIIEGERVVPELIQKQANPVEIARTVSHLLSDPDALSDLRRRLRSVRARLGEAGASAKTADIALSMIRNRKSKTGLSTNNFPVLS